MVIRPTGGPGAQRGYGSAPPPEVVFLRQGFSQWSGGFGDIPAGGLALPLNRGLTGYRFADGNGGYVPGRVFSGDNGTYVFNTGTVVINGRASLIPQGVYNPATGTVDRMGVQTFQQTLRQGVVQQVGATTTAITNFTTARDAVGGTPRERLVALHAQATTAFERMNETIDAAHQRGIGELDLRPTDETDDNGRPIYSRAGYLGTYHLRNDGGIEFRPQEGTSGHVSGTRVRHQVYYTSNHLWHEYTPDIDLPTLPPLPPAPPVETRRFEFLEGVMERKD